MPLPVRTCISLLLTVPLTTALLAQPPDRGPGGPGGGRGFSREAAKLVEKFDANQSGRLEREERDAARKWLEQEGNQRRGGRRGRGFGRRGEEPAEPPAPGPRVSADQVETYPDRKLYDTEVLRTLFFEFAHDDWQEELAAFYRSDVEVPADMIVDGQRLEQVGVRVRGNTSFMFVPDGRKKSLNIAIDFVDAKQRLYGYKTLNLLNCHGDPSFLHEVLHAHIGRQFAPVPRANLVHVVINGESWGVFANVQQINKDYAREAFGTRNGARWRVPPDFRGNGGMKYLGEDAAEYEDYYQAKSGVDEAAMQRLVEVCRTLNETTVAERRNGLPALLDIDGALWFLALDNVLLDGDGYLTRASDHALYLDPTGVFHLITYDNNEILGGSPSRGGGPPGGRRGGGPPGRGGPGGPGGHRIHPNQSPLAGHDDENRPLLHRLLEVPEWRARYLAFVHSLATQALDWARLGPEVERMHALITRVTHDDTRKLYSNEDFDGSVEELLEMVTQRVGALLQHETMTGPWPTVERVDTEEVVVSDGRVLRVTARAGGDVDVRGAWLHWQDKQPGPFVAVPMESDEVGVFQADIRSKGRIRYYVEMRSGGDTPRAAFHPAGASSNAARHKFGR